MASPSELFDLIKMLSKAEKRYFSLYAQFQDGAKSYMTLLKEIDSLEVYDEAVLKQKLATKNYNTSHLAVAKVQLSKLIMKSLRAFHESNTPEQKVLAQMAEADILRKKGLYNLTMKQLERAKSAAAELEMNNYVLQILNKQIALGVSSFEKNWNEKLNIFFEEVETLGSIVQKETELKLLTDRLLHLFQTKPLKHPSTIESLKQFEQHPMLADIADSDSFFSKIYYFFSHAIIKHAKGDFAAANPNYFKILELWDRNSSLKIIHRRLYKSHIANYLNSCHLLGKYDDFDFWLEKFTKVPDLNYDEEAGSFKDFYHIKLLYLLNTYQFEAALKITKDVAQGLGKYKQRLTKSRETVLRFNIFLTYFINEKFSDSLDWLQTMELDVKIDARADARALARIMQVIVHSELGHTRILDSLRTSVYRKLKKDEQLHEFERTILNHVRQMEAVTSKKEQRQLWGALVENLTGLDEKYGRGKIFGLDEITGWAESRYLGKPYMQVLKDKKLQ
ncbi:MAG: hypothetical protein IT258_17555 [Saprospiraceae bacterium]|nr:hypothetical protein [Saprospiraceae bacterium]